MTAVLTTAETPLGRRLIQEYTLADYASLGCLPPSLFEGVTEVRHNIIPRSGHSVGGILYFKGNNGIDRRLFVKQLLPTDDSSETYRSKRDPEKLYLREVRTIKCISASVGSDIVQKLVGSDEAYLLIFQTYGRYHSDNTRLASVDQWYDRERIIFSGHRSLACIDGRLQAREHHFPQTLLNEHYTPRIKKAEIVDYLIALSRFKAESNNWSFPVGEGMLAQKFIKEKYGIELRQAIDELVDLLPALEFEMTPQHGDARTHHLLGPADKKGDEPEQRKLVDWDRFGLYPLGFSHVTYAGTEGGLADLPLDKLEDLGGWVLSYRKAANQRDRRQRKKDVRKLDRIATQKSRRAVAQQVSGEERARFALQYLALAIEDHVHLLSSSSRYSNEQRESFIRMIPGWNHALMFGDRPRRLETIFETVADMPDRFAAFDDIDGARSYFAKWADVLQRMEIVDLPEPLLSKLSS